MNKLNPTTNIPLSLDELIKVREIQGTCGLNGDLLADNPSLNEIKVFDQDSNERLDNPICGISNGIYIQACANAYTTGVSLLLNVGFTLNPVDNIDVFLGDELKTTLAGASCSEEFTVAAHETGHALVFYGSPFFSRGYHARGHSHVVPSIMSFMRSEIFKHCAPTYYDVSAISAAYQGRFIITNEE